MCSVCASGDAWSSDSHRNATIQAFSKNPENAKTWKSQKRYYSNTSLTFLRIHGADLRRNVTIQTFCPIPQKLTESCPDHCISLGKWTFPAFLMILLSPLGFRAARRGIPETQKKAFPSFLDANPAEVTLLGKTQIFPRFQIFKCTALNRSQANVHMDLVSGSEGLPGSRNAPLQTLDRGGPHEAWNFEKRIQGTLPR